MKVSELHALLARVLVNGKDPEIRVGDQIESGPYLHASVGGVFEGTGGDIILCGNDDDQWKDESVSDSDDDPELPVLWQPPEGLTIG